MSPECSDMSPECSEMFSERSEMSPECSEMSGASRERGNDGGEAAVISVTKSEKIGNSPNSV